MEIEERARELREQLNYHIYRYHVLDSPIISDAEYDKLYLELKEIEEEYPDLVRSDSPTQRAGAEPLERFEKVEHPAPILSLANAFTKADLEAWRKRIDGLLPANRELDYVVEPKIDGLTVVLTFRNGQFVQGATRGNGEVGEDVTVNLRTLMTLPQQIPVDPESDLIPPAYLVVRGEVFFPLDKFESLNEERLSKGEPLYMNPRNTAAGSIRQLDPKKAAERPLTLFCYDLIIWDGMAVPEQQWARLQLLKELGFPVSDDIYLASDLESIITYYNEWIEKRNKINYEVDGIVIKINDQPLAQSLGYVGKDPRGAIAMKFPAQEKTTKLVDVTVNVGRTGVLAPNAVLEPVEIGGVVVRNATLHNYDEIKRKDIRVGDTVLVKRAGDVIPYIIGPVVDARNGTEQAIKPPDKCPFCESDVVDLPGEVAIYCDNPACPEQLIRRVEYFASRGAMDIDNFGSKTGALLVEEGFIHDYADIFYLERSDLLSLEGFKEKKVDNLLAGIEQSKDQPVERVLTALGIRFVGSTVAGILMDHYETIDDLSVASRAELENIDGIGPETAAAVVTWFKSSENLKVLEKLRVAGLHFKKSGEAVVSDTLDGLTFVITGTLPSMTRTEAKEFIELRGGRVTGSVSRKTNYLLAGDAAGSKLVKAQKLEVPVIDEDQLLELVGDGR